MIHPEIINLESLSKIIATDRKWGCRRRVIFTYGYFDILDVYQIEFINKISKIVRYSPTVIIGINSDKSIESIENKKPKFNQDLRSRALLGIRNVTYVMIFDGQYPLKIIKEIKPDIIVL